MKRETTAKRHEKNRLAVLEMLQIRPSGETSASLHENRHYDVGRLKFCQILNDYVAEGIAEIIPGTEGAGMATKYRLIQK